MVASVAQVNNMKFKKIHITFNQLLNLYLCGIVKIHEIQTCTLNSLLYSKNYFKCRVIISQYCYKYIRTKKRNKDTNKLETIFTKDIVVNETELKVPLWFINKVRKDKNVKKRIIA